MDRTNKLIELLRRRLGPDFREQYLGETAVRDDKSWTRTYQRIVAAARAMRRQVDHTRRRVEASLEDFEEIPEGRRATVLTNSPPSMLIALSLDLMHRSYAVRLSDSKLSLRRANLALEVVGALEDAAWPAAEIKADLGAECWGYLGNARRINGDLVGARVAFDQAERLRRRGTGEQRLEADLLNLRSSLEFAQGDWTEAVRILEKEVGVRRRLGQQEALGKALMDLATVTSWTGSIEKAQQHLDEGIRLSVNSVAIVSAMGSIAERLARDGHASKAWKMICHARVVELQTGVSEEHPRLAPHLGWVEALALRALGDLDDAARTLQEVRAYFLEPGTENRFRAALVSLDLAVVYASQGKLSQVRELAEDAYAVFKAERVENRALAALQVLREAARSQRLTASLALGVVNFIVRRQYDKSLTFEPEGTRNKR